MLLPLGSLCETQSVALRISHLGTASAVVSAPMEEKVGWFRRMLVEREFSYLEWTVDGVPLREVMAWPGGEVAGEVTPVRNGYAMREYEADYLRAMLGKEVTLDWTVMPDERVPLLVCHIDFDLGCRALTATVVRDGDAVEWRDIAWQVDHEPLDLDEQESPVVSLAFQREQYDGVVAPLLASALSA